MGQDSENLFGQYDDAHSLPNRPPDEIIKVGIRQREMAIFRCIMDNTIKIATQFLPRIKTDARSKLDEYIHMVAHEYGRDMQTKEYAEVNDISQAFARVNTKIINIVQNYLDLEPEYSTVLMLALSIATISSLGMLTERAGEIDFSEED